MKNQEYSAETLLKVLASYLIQINRSGRDFPTVVLSDIGASIQSILKETNRA